MKIPKLLVLGTLLVAMCMAVPAMAIPFHGATILKNVVGPDGINPIARVGDTVTATIEVINQDDFGDTITVQTITDTVHHTSGDVTTSNLLAAPVVLSNKGDLVEVSHTYVVAADDVTSPPHLLTDDAHSTGTDSGLILPFNISFPGQLLVIRPAIDVEKYVWDGDSFEDADSTTGPQLLSAQNPVVFQFIITNDGDSTLTNVTLSDTDMAAFFTDSACTIPAVFPIASLASAASVTVYGKLPWAIGQHTDTATATGTPAVGPNVSDTDPANYIGVDARISIVESATNQVNDDHSFTVTVEFNDGGGWDPAVGVSVTGSTDFGTITSTNPALTNASGQMTITVNSATPGTATVHASATVGSVAVATNGYGAFLVHNQKTWVDARISIVESATNPVDTPHNFTVTVEQNDGAGWDPAVGVSVTGSTDFGTITSTNPALTNASGQMTITVNSAIPGTATVHASATVSVGGIDIAVATNGYGAYIVHNQKTWIERPNAFCSFTQGAYGNAGGKDCGDMTTPEVIGAIIGDGVVVGIEGERSIKLLTAACIITRLPAGGTPMALPAGLNVTDNCDSASNTALDAVLTKAKGKDKERSYNNVLIGQVVTLTLNLRLNQIPCLGADTEDPGDDDGDLGGYMFDPVAEYICVQEGEDGCIERHMVPEALRGFTPDEVLLAANMALAGDEGVDIGLINDAVTFINELFDECRTIVTCPIDPVEICDNGCDDDFDGLVDLADPDCAI